MLRFINYIRTLFQSTSITPKSFRITFKCLRRLPTRKRLEAVGGGAEEKLDWDLLFILPDGQMSETFELETGLSWSSKWSLVHRRLY